jgi:uncharacterized protein DUF5681
MKNSGDHGIPDDQAPTKNRRDYKVGYRKPPVEHRFKQGKSANPRGRKKGARNRKIVVRDILFEPVQVREGGGEIKQMPALEAVMKKILSKALGGDSKASFAIIAIAQKEGFLTPDQEQLVDNLSESDQAILTDAMKRMGASTAEQTSEPPTGDGAA